MKIKKLTTADVADYLRLDEDDPIRLKPVMQAAKAYILDYTGLDEDDLDDHDDLAIAFLVLCQDMYDNRALYTDKAGINKVVDAILFRHRRNFV